MYMYISCRDKLTYIDCQDPQVFQTDCYSWTAQFKAAAEAACGLTCPS